MKLTPQSIVAATPGLVVRGPWSCGHASAFTLVEIAISLAIIGFALVAIIGVLPIGMNVQRENREETIINQEAAVFMDAIRSGARGLDDLTNYVEAITNVHTEFHKDGTVQVARRYGYTRTNWTIDHVDQGLGYELTNGYRIIGLLSTPKYVYDWRADLLGRQVIWKSNYVVAHVRAMSGLAAEKFPQTNLDVRDQAFSYRMLSEIMPYVGWNPAWVDLSGLTPEEVAARSRYWDATRILHSNLWDVRLSFRWPLLPGGKIGNGRQFFRTMVSGTLTNEPVEGTWWFFQPQTFQSCVNAPPP